MCFEILMPRRNVARFGASYIFLIADTRERHGNDVFNVKNLTAKCLFCFLGG